jgi:hypothetical protein
MTHISEIIEDILVEWAYRVHDGMPNPKNVNHIQQLRESMEDLNLPNNVIYQVINNLINEQTEKLSKQGVLDVLKKHKDLEQQGTVKTKIYGDLEPKDFVKALKSQFKGVTDIKEFSPGEGNNTSGRDTLFQWKHDGHDYEIHLAKLTVTGGRGANQTRDQELSWLLVLSGMQYGLDPSDKEAFISGIISNSQIYGKVDGVNEKDALGLAAYIENNDDWYQSHVSQCEKFISIVGANNQPKKYVKDGSSLSVNQQAKKLYEQEYGRKLDLDKWNPADVWLEYQSVPTFKTLAELNNYLIDSLHKGTGFIGVSLKKGKGSVGLVNDYKRKEYILKKLGVKYGGLFSQGVTFDYSGTNLDGLGLNFRIFQAKATETIRGEGIAKGAQAVQGKVAMAVIDDFKSGTLSKIKAVQGVSVDYDKKTKTFKWNKKGLSRFNKVKTAYGKIKQATYAKTHGDWNAAFKSSDDFMRILNDYAKKKNIKENSMKANINARFQTVILGSIISNLSAKDKQEVMVGLLKYGKSESDWSSAHYKAQ